MYMCIYVYHVFIVFQCFVAPRTRRRTQAVNLDIHTTLIPCPLSKYNGCAGTVYIFIGETVLLVDRKLVSMIRIVSCLIILRDMHFDFLILCNV